jgi:hypothetical protein
MQIKLKSGLAKQFNYQGNLSELERATGLSYPTVLNLAKGEADAQALDKLGRFLTGLGLTPAELVFLRFGDIFEVEP